MRTLDWKEKKKTSERLEASLNCFYNFYFQTVRRESEVEDGLTGGRKGGNRGGSGEVDPDAAG